jgi:hypothetical protein
MKKFNFITLNNWDDYFILYQPQNPRRGSIKKVVGEKRQEESKYNGELRTRRIVWRVKQQKYSLACFKSFNKGSI